MTWLLANADNTLVDPTPVDDEPTPAAGQRAVPVALGYPDTMEWSVDLGGFVDKAAPTDALAMLVDTLVARKALTAADASAIMAARST